MTQQLLFAKGIKFQQSLVGQIGANAWQNITPCSPWSVHDLINHLAYEYLWVPELLDGKTVSQVGNKYEGDVLGSNPAISYLESSLAAAAAIAKVDPKKVVHLSSGVVPAEEYIYQLCIEAIIHSWDIAKSAELDNTIPSELVKSLYEMTLARKLAIEAAGVYGQSLSMPTGASLQTKLLALFGRS